MATAPSVLVSDGRSRLEKGALAWLIANPDVFDPPQEDEITDERPEAILPGPRRKAFGELGLALRLCNRIPRMRSEPEVRHLTAAWLRAAAERRIFFDARRRVHLFPLLAVALTVQSDMGMVDGRARRDLQAALDRGFLDRTERSAWGQVDIAYYLDAVGLRHDLPDGATAFRRSSLIRPPVMAHALRIDLYAVTHLVFHLTDFGATGMAGASADEIERLRDYLALALATCMAERDWDLTGECLAARACLGTAPGALEDHAVDALVNAQRPSGFVPDMSWLGARERSDPPFDTAAAEAAAVYHPTLVSLIMLACAEAAGIRVGGRT